MILALNTKKHRYKLKSIKRRPREIFKNKNSLMDNKSKRIIMLWWLK